MKKTIALFLCLLISAGAPLSAYAASPWNTAEENAVTAAAASSGLELTCKSAILIEPETGTVIYEHEPDIRLPEASITKVMTMLLVFEALDSGRITMEDIVTCSDYAASMGGSQIWLEPGEQMTVQELIKAAMVGSANDASVALAEHTAGSHESFVALMNARAAELGMTNTAYKNCTGLDAEGHFTSARDIATVSAELLRHSGVLEFSTIWMDSMRGGELELVNTNKLIRSYEGAIGLKTGTTSQAGCCVSAAAQRDGMTLVAVVMGAPNSAGRFSDARKLLDFGFAGCELLDLESVELEGREISVINGVKPALPTGDNLAGHVLIPKGRAADVTAEVTIAESVEAPVECGQTVGKVRLMLDGAELGSYGIVTLEGTEEITFGAAFGFLWRGLIKNM